MLDESIASEERNRDRSVFISFGLVLSLKIDDVEKVRSWLEENGAKIVFQTVGAGPLFLLREYQVKKVLHGDTSELREIYNRKIKPVVRALVAGFTKQNKKGEWRNE